MALWGHHEGHFPLELLLARCAPAPAQVWDQVGIWVWIQVWIQAHSQQVSSGVGSDMDSGMDYLEYLLPHSWLHVFSWSNPGALQW